MRFHTSNKTLVAILTFMFRKKIKTYSFTFERSYYDHDLIDWQVKANYIRDLQASVDEFIKELEKTK